MTLAKIAGKLPVQVLHSKADAQMFVARCGAAIAVCLDESHDGYLAAWGNFEAFVNDTSDGAQDRAAAGYESGSSSGEEGLEDEDDSMSDDDSDDEYMDDEDEEEI